MIWFVYGGLSYQLPKILSADGGCVSFGDKLTVTACKMHVELDGAETVACFDYTLSMVSSDIIRQAELPNHHFCSLWSMLHGRNNRTFTAPNVSVLKLQRMEREKIPGRSRHDVVLIWHWARERSNDLNNVCAKWPVSLTRTSLFAMARSQHTCPKLGKIFWRPQN